MTIVFYISGHGLGHASRDIEVIHANLARRPDARIVIRTGAEPWLFALNVPQAELQPCEVDTGVVQIDSLQFDEPRTVHEAAAFYRTFSERADREARVLTAADADVVVPLGCQLTRTAIQGLHRCRHIPSSGIGFDHIDAVAATEAGIVVTNMAETFVEEVANTAWLLLLMVAGEGKPEHC